VLCQSLHLQLPQVILYSRVIDAKLNSETSKNELLEWPVSQVFVSSSILNSVCKLMMMMIRSILPTTFGLRKNFMLPTELLEIVH